MIDILLNAYMREERSWSKMLKKTDNISKAYLITAIVYAIGVMITSWHMSWRIFGISTAIFLILTVGFLFVSKRLAMKKWKVIANDYNKELDRIAGILKRSEFDSYDKTKIKHLIKKYERSIQEIDIEDSKKNERSSNFIQIYIIPIIAYFIGSNSIAENVEAGIEWAVLLVLILVGGKFVLYLIKEVNYMILGNQREEKKHFMHVLQDLLDRDFS